RRTLYWCAPPFSYPRQPVRDAHVRADAPARARMPSSARTSFLYSVERKSEGLSILTSWEISADQSGRRLRAPRAQPARIERYLQAAPDRDRRQSWWAL